MKFFSVQRLDRIDSAPDAVIDLRGRKPRGIPPIQRESRCTHCGRSLAITRASARRRPMCECGGIVAPIYVGVR